MLFSAPNARKNEAYETIKTVVIALLFAFVFRSLVFEPFHIPSGSMKSNLLVGDYLFVSKYSYGYSKYSFPFSPDLFKGRVLELNTPKRGDVVVFRPPGEPRIDFIKRLIGLPGDHIQMKEGILYINDKPVTKDYVDDWVDDDSQPPATLKRYKETLPEGKTFQTLYENPLGVMENTDVYTVPEGHYFMMGDNRDHSKDSRYVNDVVGFVPAENIVGRAEMILFSWEGGLSFRTDRFFKLIP